MKEDVTKYVHGCEKCQHSKPDRTKRYAPLHPHATPPHPWHTISWDVIGPLPKSNTYDCILVICDKLTKLTLLEPVNTTLTALGAARILRDRVLQSYGVPCKIISNRGPQFVSNFMKEFYNLVGIKGNPSTAYHPQMDGQTEQEN